LDFWSLDPFFSPAPFWGVLGWVFVTPGGGSPAPKKTMVFGSTKPPPPFHATKKNTQPLFFLFVVSVSVGVAKTRNFSTNRQGERPCVRKKQHRKISFFAFFLGCFFCLGLPTWIMFPLSSNNPPFSQPFYFFFCVPLGGGGTFVGIGFFPPLLNGTKNFPPSFFFFFYWKTKPRFGGFLGNPPNQQVNPLKPPRGMVRNPTPLLVCVCPRAALGWWWWGLLVYWGQTCVLGGEGGCWGGRVNPA